MFPKSGVRIMPGEGGDLLRWETKVWSYIGENLLKLKTKSFKFLKVMGKTVGSALNITKGWRKSYRSCVKEVMGEK